MAPPNKIKLKNYTKDFINGVIIFHFPDYWDANQYNIARERFANGKYHGTLTPLWTYIVYVARTHQNKDV